jgi:hypothetical protein
VLPVWLVRQNHLGLQYLYQRLKLIAELDNRNRSNVLLIQALLHHSYHYRSLGIVAQQLVFAEQVDTVAE